MSALVRYEAARTALAEAHRVDEVKDIRDKAEAMAAYARQAKDTEMVKWVTEIKVRAERRAGELLAQMKSSGELTPHGGDRRSESRSETTNLNDVGITPDQSSRWQSLASMSDDHFETAVATAKETAGQVTTAFMLREARKDKPARKMTKRDRERLQELEDAKSRGVSMLTTYARLTLTALRASKALDQQEVEVLMELAEAIQEVSETA